MFYICVKFLKEVAFKRRKRLYDKKGKQVRKSTLIGLSTIATVKTNKQKINNCYSTSFKVFAAMHLADFVSLLLLIYKSMYTENDSSSGGLFCIRLWDLQEVNFCFKLINFFGPSGEMHCQCTQIGHSFTTVIFLTTI